MECESLRESGAEIKKFDVAYFTASCDEVEKNTEFAKKLKLDYPILSDPGKVVAKAYGVVTSGRPFPHRWTVYISKDGKILEVDREVKIPSAGATIAKKLGEHKVAAAEKSS